MLLFSQFEFAYPSNLLALAVVPVLGWLAWRFPRSGPGWSRWGTCLCRMLLAALLVLAAAAPRDRRTAMEAATLVARDQSASIDTGASPTLDSNTDLGPTVRRIGFAAESSTPADAFPQPPKALGSNPQAAVETAIAAAPGEQYAKIVLATDGRQTSGDVLAAAASAGYPVDVVPLASFTKPEVAVRSIRAPTTSASLETLSLHVELASNFDGPVEVRLFRDGQPLATEPATLVDGQANVAFNDTMTGRKPIVYTAEVSAANDQFSQNNRRRCVVSPAPPRNAWLVFSEAAKAEPLQETLGELGFQSKTISVEQLAAADSLNAVDLIFLSGVSPEQLTATRWAQISQFVRSGGGLIVAGGEPVFGREALAGSPLEVIAPVNAAPPVEKKETVMAMVLVIDKSKSMEEDRRLDLAKSGARRVVEFLGPEDKAGLLAFGSESQWVSELAPLSDKQTVLARIDRLAAVGRTNMYPALVRAQLALEQTDADQRHVILLTDGVSSPGDFSQIARRMAASGIGVSTVSVSAGADQTILKDIARIAGGAHRHCENPEDLDDIVVEAAEEAASDEAPSDFQPYVLRSLPGLDISAAPPFAGSTRTGPKADAESLLLTPGGDPLLSWRRYGSGAVAAFTADLEGKPAARFRNWEGYTPFLGRLTQHMSRGKQRPMATCVMTADAQRLVITVEALQSSEAGVGFHNGGKFTAQVSVRPDEGSPSTTSLPLQQTAPGVYQGVIESPVPGVYTAEVQSPYGASNVSLLRCGAAVDYAAEYDLAPSPLGLLPAVAMVSGGTFDPNAEQLKQVPPSRGVYLHPYWSFFLLAAALVLMLEVMLRRIPLVLGM